MTLEPKVSVKINHTLWYLRKMWISVMGPLSTDPFLLLLCLCFSASRGYQVYQQPLLEIELQGQDRGSTSQRQIEYDGSIFIYLGMAGTDLSLALLPFPCYRCFHARPFVDALWSPAGKADSRLCCLIVTLSLSHRYPGSDVVLDCIDS